jgi:hypothetical protein
MQSIGYRVPVNERLTSTWRIREVKNNTDKKMKTQIIKSEPKPVGRPLADTTAASHHIHLRVVKARKNWYIRTARLYNLTLSEWMQLECDKASAYPPDNQYERV